MIGDVHHNNFGAIRLLLAYAVVASHAPQMIDGSFNHEPLVALGSHITLGSLAVDGFFIISGYLIANSYFAKPSLVRFLSARIFRIYPAFVVACLICIVVVAPLSGATLANLPSRWWEITIGKLLFLVSPEVPGTFHSLPLPALDGSMWTIKNEFRCYLLIAILGSSGLLQRRNFSLALTLALYSVATVLLLYNYQMREGLAHKIVFAAIGDPSIAIMLTAIFMSGVCFRLYREQIEFRPEFLIASAALLCFSILRSELIELVVGSLGTYILLWAATSMKSTILQNINNRYDFSYGTYLYAWPIATLILWFFRAHISIQPAELTVVTMILATIAGAISWYIIEKPMLSYGKNLTASLATRPAAAPL